MIYVYKPSGIFGWVLVPPIKKSASTSSPTAKVIWCHSRICFARCFELP